MADKLTLSTRVLTKKKKVDKRRLNELMRATGSRGRTKFVGGVKVKE